MASNLEYIYKLKDQYSKQLAKITSAQLKFREIYLKSSRDINSASLRQRNYVRENLRVNSEFSRITKQGLQCIANQYRENISLAQQYKKQLGTISVVHRSNARASRVASASFSNGLRQASAMTSSLTGQIFNLRNMLMGTLAGFGLFKLISYPIQQGAFLEDQLTSYAVKLKGDEEAAKKLVKQMQILGAQTPFNFPDLARTADKLLGIGDITKDNLITRLRIMGDLSQGSSDKLARISLAYSQILGKGKLMAQESNQLTEAGIAPAMMAEALGLTTQRFLALREQGKISGAVVTKSFELMTSKGGRFYQMMIKKSQTFNGLISNFIDYIQISAQTLGNQLLPSAKQIVIKLTEIVKQMEAWTSANKKWINTKVLEYMGKLRKAYHYVIQNKEKIIRITLTLVKALGYLLAANIALKIAIGIQNVALLIHKGLLLATKIMTFLYSVALGINTVAVGTNTMALRGNIVALTTAKVIMGIVRTATLLWTGAIWLLNSAFLATPIGWIVLAIGALIGLIVLVVKKTNSWKDALKLLGGIFIKTILTPINLVIAGLIKLADLMSLLPGQMGSAFGKISSQMKMIQDKMNITLTGNKSLTTYGMIYDIAKSKEGGSDVSNWIEKETKVISQQPNYVEMKPQQLGVSGNIKVEAEKGTKVNYSNFGFNIGPNMAWGEQ